MLKYTKFWHCYFNMTPHCANHHCDNNWINLQKKKNVMLLYYNIFLLWWLSKLPPTESMDLHYRGVVGNTNPWVHFSVLWPIAPLKLQQYMRIAKYYLGANWAFKKLIGAIAPNAHSCNDGPALQRDNWKHRKQMLLSLCISLFLSAAVILDFFYSLPCSRLWISKWWDVENEKYCSNYLLTLQGCFHVFEIYRA